MAAGKSLLSRVPNHFVQDITFTGASGLGLVNVSVSVARVTGEVLITNMGIYCVTSLAGASATISLGSAGNTAAIIAATTATDIDSGDWWTDTTPAQQTATAIKDTLLDAGGLQYEPLTATISGGRLRLMLFWLPLSTDGQLRGPA